MRIRATGRVLQVDEGIQAGEKGRAWRSLSKWWSGPDEVDLINPAADGAPRRRRSGRRDAAAAIIAAGRRSSQRMRRSNKWINRSAPAPKLDGDGAPPSKSRFRRRAFDGVERIAKEKAKNKKNVVVDEHRPFECVRLVSCNGPVGFVFFGFFWFLFLLLWFFGALLSRAGVRGRWRTSAHQKKNKKQPNANPNQMADRVETRNRLIWFDKNQIQLPSTYPWRTRNIDLLRPPPTPGAGGGVLFHHQVEDPSS